MKVRSLGLPEAAGSVPVLYVGAAKDRALRLQKSLEAAHAWYEEQLRVRVPIVLAVLDSEAGDKVHVSTALPHSVYSETPALVIIPAIVQNSPPAGHEDFLEHEPAQFHEDGHILANSLKIWSGNAFVNELIAQMFSVAYIEGKRPDLNWVVEAMRAGRRSDGLQTPLRYTSLADLDYIYTAMGAPNYVWFQQAALGRLADFLVQGQSFASVVEKLQKAFPAAAQKQEPLEEISRHLEGIRPGFLKAAGALAGPTTLPQIKPSECTQSPAGSAPSYVVVRNNTSSELIVTTPTGRERKVAAHSWWLFQLAVGASLRLPDGSCLVAADEPSLAVIEKH